MATDNAEVVDVERQKAIDEAKAKYGKVYQTTFNGVEQFVIRQLTRMEYKQLIQNLLGVENDLQRQELHDEHIAAAAVVWPKVTPEFLAKSGAGFVSLLADQIMKASGFTNVIQTVEI